MSAGLVNANSEDLRRLAASLLKYHEAVTLSFAHVAGVLQSCQWQDRQREAFEERLATVERMLRQALLVELTELTQHVHRLAAHLDEIT